jgi:hypothetical protein
MTVEQSIGPGSALDGPSPAAGQWAHRKSSKARRKHEETALPGVRNHAKRAFAWLSAAALLSAAASFGAEVTSADLDAAVRSLGFLASLQNRSTILIGVVYNGSDPTGRAQAQRVAGDLARLAGPGSATISAVPVAVQDLAGQRFDAIYLMSLPPELGHGVGDYVRHQSVVSVSSDPQCLDVQSCVLMVQARSSTSVVLDTALARAVGAKFSTVFTMLVKRK